MDREFQERIRKLERLLAEDEICRGYRDSARELDAALGDLMRRLPQEDREILLGLRECAALLRLREQPLLCEPMRCAETCKNSTGPEGAGRCCVSAPVGTISESPVLR